MDTLLTIKEADLTCIYSELTNIKLELDRIKKPIELDTLDKKQIYKLME